MKMFTTAVICAVNSLGAKYFGYFCLYLLWSKTPTELLETGLALPNSGKA